MFDRISAIRGRRPYAAMLGLVLAAGLAVSLGSVRRTDSDPFLTLFTSTALVRRQTIRLDPYRAFLPEHYAWQAHGGHFYNAYPLGPSLVALPLVFAADRLGVDCVAQSPALQMVLSALCAMATVALLFSIARCLLPPLPSLIGAAVFFFGTGLSSSNGTAYWTHTVSTVFVLLAMRLLVRPPRGAAPAWDAGLGLTLFVAYLCRPTAALFAVFALLTLACRDAKRALVAGLWTALGLAVYFACNVMEFGTPLTPYARQAMHGNAPLAAFVGLLARPNRGLFVFSPFLVVLAAYCPVLRRRRDPLLLLALAWPLSLTVILSFWYNWWGGHSFGPRLLTDLLPGLFLLGCLIAASLPRPRTFSALCLLVDPSPGPDQPAGLDVERTGGHRPAPGKEFRLARHAAAGRHAPWPFPGPDPGRTMKKGGRGRPCTSYAATTPTTWGC